MGYLVDSHDLMRSTTLDPRHRQLIVGADIGQKVDPTALVVAEAIGQGYGRVATWSYTIRHMERLAVGTDYPSVAARILQVVVRIGAQPEPPLTRLASKVHVVVDATGAGAPVVDILRREMQETATLLTEATFTHGDRLTGHYSSSKVSVGKAYLVSRLQALFQTGRVQLPANHPEAQAMMRELMDYEIRISEDANDKYGAFRTGTHDDLVTAPGLAVLEDPRIPGKIVGFR